MPWFGQSSRNIIGPIWGRVRERIAHTSAETASEKESAVVRKSHPFADSLSATQTFMMQPGKAVWMGRDYRKFSEEAYIKNVIAYRSIAMIAQSAASVPFLLQQHTAEGERLTLKRHPVLQLLSAPNPGQGGSEFIESVLSFYLISGNAYIQAVGQSESGGPKELYTLRPDRMSVIAGRRALPAGYRYSVRDVQGAERHMDFPVDTLTGRSRILHLKHFHPLNDWYGLSPIEAAAYSIDQHNQAGAWNQAMLQNGARPSGALMVKATENGTGHLNEEQFYRLKQQIDEQYTGAMNAGRPILLEGGLEWKEMSLSPRDMDFINAKHSSARDIALAFGVPPQLLGVPGDNTYNNLAEARLALWEQTILPLLDKFCDALNQWLIPQFDPNITISCDLDGISALTLRREKMWDRISNASFLSESEKRSLLGISD